MLIQYKLFSKLKLMSIDNQIAEKRESRVSLVGNSALIKFSLKSNRQHRMLAIVTSSITIDD